MASLAAVALLIVTATSLAAQQPAPQPEEKIGPALLAPDRIAGLPAPQRAAWTKYLNVSRQLHERDSIALHASHARHELLLRDGNMALHPHVRQRGNDMTDPFPVAHGNGNA